MTTNQGIIRRLSEIEGSLAAVGDRLGEMAGLPKDKRPDHRVVWNWTERGTPMKWRYYVCQLAKQHGVEIDEVAFLSGQVAA